MRKRTIIAVIFTIGAVLALNKFWLKFSPMPVDLDIQGKGMTNVNVIFNNKNNDSFYHIRQNGARINLDKTGHAEIFVDKAKFPKRIRIILSGFDGNRDFVLSNVQLRYGKLNLDLNKFKIEGGNSEVKNNKLFLKAKDEIVTLTYPDRLNIRASFKFDFMLFVIFTVLIYLLAFKLSDYIADFKTVKGKSRVDIIFLAVFFICLCIPASNINQDRISVQENRTLAAWHPLFQPEYGINYNFGNDFNNWFDDRFNTRKFLIYLNYKLKYILPDTWFVTDSAIYNKKTHWAFGKYYIFYLQDADKTNLKRDVLTRLNRLNQFCNDNNIKLYILLTPYTPEVYYEEIPKYINNKRLQTDKNNFIKDIIKKTDANVIYPYYDLRRVKKQNRVYFKQDHHWTDYGAYIGYQALIKRIQKDFPDVKPVSLENYTTSKSRFTRKDFYRNYTLGHTISTYLPYLAKYADKFQDVEYTYYTQKNKSLLKVNIINNTHERAKNFYYPNGSNYKVMEIGTSMNHNLTEFTPYTFKNLKYIILNEVMNRKTEDYEKIMKYYKNEIIEYKPDIIIFCITPSNLFVDSKYWFEE